MAISGICAVEDCGKKHFAKSFCANHYRRFRLYGSPYLTKCTPAGSTSAFFKSVVSPYRGEECLIWPYGGTTAGYGLVTLDGRKGYAHRFICEERNGPPPSGRYHAAHECGNNRCVNGSHLSWKTAKENELDKIIHGTHNRGERAGASKLTEADVRDILALRGVELQKDIAKRYGVIRQSISDIHRGKTWSWLSSALDIEGEPV